MLLFMILFFRLGVFQQLRDMTKDGFLNVLNPRNRHMSCQIRQNVESVISSERNGMFKRMFLEARITELLLYQTERLVKDQEVNLFLNEGSAEKIVAIREYIISKSSC